MCAAMKFALVIVALVCCMEFVEMARFRRDDAVAAPAPDFTKTIQTILETFKNQIADFKPEDTKALIDKVTTTVKEQLEKAGHIVKETIDTVNKEEKTD